MKPLLVYTIIAILSISLTTYGIAPVSAIPDNLPDSARFITSSTDSQVLDAYESKGCKVKYVFDEMSALDCPPAIGRMMGLEQDIQIFALDSNANTQVTATEAQGLGLTGNGVIVAVLDTGVDFSHNELSSSNAGGKSFVGYTASYDDDEGHGTFVSGLITSDGLDDPYSLGSAPDAGIWAGKVLDSTGSGVLSDTVAAINHVTDNDSADVISLSLGTGYPYTYKGKNCDQVYPAMTSAIHNAISSGITVVAAAGNSGSLGVGLPGCISKVLTIGAIDSRDSPASFSSEGRSVDVVALGVDDYSTRNGGGYDYGSGTSFSTPVVSGVVALLIENDNSLTPDGIQELLRNTAVDVGKKGFDSKTGYGKVDTIAALNYSPSNDSDDGGNGNTCPPGKEKQNKC